MHWCRRSRLIGSMYGPREFFLTMNNYLGSARIVHLDLDSKLCHDACTVSGAHDCPSFCSIQGEEHLTCYTFNTHQAKHTFCSKCGVQSFYTPRSNPDGRGVNYRCLDPGTVDNVNIITFDGQNWEATIESEPSIRTRSK